MELQNIIIRILFTYVFLLAIIRISGKRTVTQGTPFDFVLALVLGDMIDDAIWSEVPMAQFIVAAATLTLAQIIVALLNYHIPAFSKIVEGEPALFMRGGQLQRQSLRRERISEREAEEMIRLAGGLEREEWSQVKSARMEEDGRPSVLLHDDAREAQRSDLELVKKMWKKSEEGKG